DDEWVTQEKKIVYEQEIEDDWRVLDALGKDFAELAVSSEGSLWAIGDDGLFHWEGRDWRIFELPPNLEEQMKASSVLLPEVTDLAVTADETVWVGTRENGLYRFADEMWQHFPAPDGPPHPFVRSLAIDPQNRLWGVFTDVGAYSLTYFDGEQWESVSLETAMGQPNSVSMMPSGAVWLSVPSFRPHLLLETDLWIASTNGWDIGSADMYLAASLTGDLWAGSDYSWAKWTGQGWVRPEQTLPAPFSYPVAVDADGGAWGIATTSCYHCSVPDYNEKGAVYVTLKNACRFTAADGLGDPPLDPTPEFSDHEIVRPDDVYDIEVTPDGRVWFITAGKLTVFYPQKPVCDYAMPNNVRLSEVPDVSGCSALPAQNLEVWQSRIEALGCLAEEPGHPVSMIEQAFDGGWILWRDDIDTISAFSLGQRQILFDSEETLTEDAETCLAQSKDALNDRFARVWCSTDRLRTLLGEPIGEEQLFETTVQSFESGSIFSTDQGVTYILTTNSDWERLD
ncbi:MAG: hypothetical protein AAF485_32800, partial [Chloroflexota bacterium]